MNAHPYSAGTWKAWVKEAMRCYPLRGIGAELSYTGSGIVIGADVDSFWRHPWTMDVRWSDKWEAFVWPGFVNGRDVTIARTVDAVETQVSLTDDDPAGLELFWRNPLRSTGLSATIDGQIVASPGEGYPPFFESLGVKPPARGGDIAEDEFAQTAVGELGRERELRACDIFLTTPRIATANSVEVLNPFTDSESLRIGTQFLNTHFANAKSRHQLLATSRWVPPPEPTKLDRFFGTAVEPQTDEIKIATVWMVSPPGADPDADPDQTWTPYSQYFVFWNLMHASIQEPPQEPDKPITFRTGLALGIADAIFSALLSATNDKFRQIEAFLYSANYKGNYWSV